MARSSDSTKVGEDHVLEGSTASTSSLPDQHDQSIDTMTTEINNINLDQQSTVTAAMGANSDSGGSLSQGATATAVEEGSNSGQTIAAASQPTFLSTFDINSNFLPLKALCSHLAIGDIVALTKTSRAFAPAYKVILHTEWNLNKRLRKFVNDPPRFRTQMAHHDVLIAGTFALQFLLRTDHNALGCGFLEMVVQQGSKADAFVQSLCHMERYELRGVDPEADGTINEVRTYGRPNDNPTNIVITITQGPPLQTILQETACTVALNFISWNKAFSIFPLTTFIRQEAYCSDGYLGSMHVYVQRMGWKTGSPILPRPQSRKHPVREERRIGDRCTWSITLKTDGVEPSETPDSIIENAFFTMHGLPLQSHFFTAGPLGPNGIKYKNYRPAPFMNYRITTLLLSARHTYLVSNSRMYSFLSYHLRKCRDLVAASDGYGDPNRFCKCSDDQYTSFCNAWEEAEATRLEADAQSSTKNELRRLLGYCSRGE